MRITLSQTLPVFTLAFLFLTAQPIQAQTVDWIQQFGPISSDTIQSVAVDGSGNVYTTGQTDGFPSVHKFNAQGTEIWKRLFSNTNSITKDIAVDASGSIYVVGRTNTALPGHTLSGPVDAFIRKYDNNGTEIWTQQFTSNGSGVDQATSVAIDTLGNVVIAGQVSGALPGQTWVGSDDAFVRKYDSSGTEIWTRQFGTGGSVQKDFAEGIATDTDNNVYIVGRVSAALPGQTYFGGGRDAYIRKYDSSGNEIWTRQYGTSGGNDLAEGVVVDEHGNAYVAGTLKISTHFEPYVRKYDAGGTLIWEEFVTGTGDANGYDIALDGVGGVYITGSIFNGILPGQTSQGLLDIFVRKYDESGTEVWTTQLGTPAQEISFAVATFEDEDVYIGGYTRGALPGQTLGGFQDAFLINLTQPPANHPPTANAGIDQTVTEGDLVVFDGSGSTDPDGLADIVSYEWTFGDGDVGSGIAPSHTYEDNGVYVATLTIEDTAGEVSIDTVTITVENAAPIVGTITADETYFILGNDTTITTEGGFTDAGVLDTHTALWDFGEGTAAGVVTETNGSGTVDGSFTYTLAGTYSIELTVTDNDGDSGVSSNTITVEVVTPAGAIQDLIELVESYNLPQGTENSLIAKLETAQQILTDGNPNNDHTAINSLNAFINAVEAQRGSTLTNQQADELIQNALAIITSIS